MWRSVCQIKERCVSVGTRQHLRHSRMRQDSLLQLQHAPRIPLVRISIVQQYRPELAPPRPWSQQPHISIPHSMKRIHSLLSSAHALNALISLAGILTLPFLMLKALPDAPMVQPLRWFIHLSGEALPLTWVLTSLALWLLLLSRMYHFKGIWKFIRQGHLKEFLPPSVTDTERARLSASCIRLE